MDGLPTTVGDRRLPARRGRAEHPIGARRIDHLVVMTPDLDRTVQAVERGLGLPLRRTRDGEASGRPMRQAFFRMGEVILEVVGPPEPDPARAGGPAGFFGLAVTVASLDAACRTARPRAAQRAEAGGAAGPADRHGALGGRLQVALALMTP